MSSIWANSINIWLRYDPKPLATHFKDRSIIWLTLYIFNLNSNGLQWLQFPDCENKFKSFFLHMKEIHLHTSFIFGSSVQIVGTHWKNSMLYKQNASICCRDMIQNGIISSISFHNVNLWTSLMCIKNNFNELPQCVYCNQI